MPVNAQVAPINGYYPGEEVVTVGFFPNGASQPSTATITGPYTPTVVRIGTGTYRITLPNYTAQVLLGATAAGADAAAPGGTRIDVDAFIEHPLFRAILVTITVRNATTGALKDIAANASSFVRLDLRFKMPQKGFAVLPTPVVTPDEIWPAAGGKRIERWIAEAAYITFNGPRSSAWTGVWNSNVWAQGVAGLQPLWLATGICGRPAVNNDTGPRKMSCTLTNPHVAGERMYVYFVHQMTTVTAGSKHILRMEDAFPADNALILLYTNTGAGAGWRGFREPTTGINEDTLVNPPTTDLNPHLGGFGFTAGGLRTHVQDAGFDDTVLAAAPAFGIKFLWLYTNSVATDGQTESMAEIILLRDEPTPSEDFAMRAYVSARYPGL